MQFHVLPFQHKVWRCGLWKQNGKDLLIATQTGESHVTDGELRYAWQSVSVHPDSAHTNAAICFSVRTQWLCFSFCQGAIFDGRLKANLNTNTVM